MADIVGWYTIDNRINDFLVDGSLKHTLKRKKNVRGITSALNVELKKFGRLQSYRDYVTIKTEILREMTADENSDEETIVARSRGDADDPADDDEPREKASTLSKKRSHADSENERIKVVAPNGRFKAESNESHEAADIDSGNGANAADYEPMKCEEAENTEEHLDSWHDDPPQKPVITCTEILKSKYKIVRDGKESSVPPPENFDPPPVEVSLQDEHHSGEQSSEARRVSRLKRFNLLYGDGDSDSSLDIDDFRDNSYMRVKEQSHSQTISDPSDIDESETRRNGKSNKTGVDRHKLHNSSLSASSSLHITDSEEEIVDDSIEKSCGEIPRLQKSSAQKSIRSQIVEQETNDSNNEKTIVATPKTVNCTSNTVPSEAESLRYVLNKLCSTGDEEELYFDSTDPRCMASQGESKNEAKILPRPIELQEFIDREELVPTIELSTITTKDMKSWSTQEGDIEIWLMEIPRSIVSDRQLCGKRLILKNDKMIMDGVSYKTISRHDRPISCILGAGKKRGRFKTVNTRPVGSIVVCQESSEMSYSTSASPVATVDASPSLVPFPDKVKSRNPLMALNVQDQRSKLSSDLSPKINDGIETKRERVSKRKLEKKPSSNKITSPGKKKSSHILKES